MRSRADEPGQPPGRARGPRPARIGDRGVGDAGRGAPLGPDRARRRGHTTWCPRRGSPRASSRSWMAAPVKKSRLGIELQDPKGLARPVITAREERADRGDHLVDLGLGVAGRDRQREDLAPRAARSGQRRAARGAPRRAAGGSAPDSGCRSAMPRSFRKFASASRRARAHHVEVIDVARPGRARPGSVERQAREARARSASASARRRSFMASSRRSSTRPIAAWMSLKRRLKPTSACTSLLSRPWSRSRRHRAATSSSLVTSERRRRPSR